MDTVRQHIKQEEFTNRWLDSYQASGKKIFCKKGCSGCCSLAVHTTFPEARNIAESLPAQQTEKLEGYIEALKGLVSDLVDLKTYLKTHRQQIGPCPFLDDNGTCTIYDQRPLSCRSLLSTRPAGWCTVDFSTLSDWDKQAYESGLDPTVVALPTHFVAATQDYARELETEILNEMRHLYGFHLTGNLPLLVWLTQQFQEDISPGSAGKLQNILLDNGLGSELLTTFCVQEPG